MAVTGPRSPSPGKRRRDYAAARVGAAARLRPLPSRRVVGGSAGGAPVVVVVVADAASVAVDGDVGGCAGCGFGGDGCGKMIAEGCSKPWPKTSSPDN